MKALYSIFFISLASVIYAQDLPVNNTTGKISFSEVVEQTQGAKEIYFAGLKFYRSTFDVEKLSIQDPEQYQLYGPMQTSFTHMGKMMYVYFNGDLQFKDGRYKYELTDLVLDTNGGGVVSLDKGFPVGMVSRKKMLEKTKTAMIEFTLYMKQEIGKWLADDDW